MADEGEEDPEEEDEDDEERTIYVTVWQYKNKKGTWVRVPLYIFMCVDPFCYKLPRMHVNIIE